MDTLTANQQLGRVLRAKRNLLGLVRRELATALTVSLHTITAIELGQRRPSEDFMQDFDKFFEVAHNRARIFPLDTIGDFIARKDLSIEETAFINIALLVTPLEGMADYIEDQETETNEET